MAAAATRTNTAPPAAPPTPTPSPTAASNRKPAAAALQPDQTNSQASAKQQPANNASANNGNVFGAVGDAWNRAWNGSMRQSGDPTNAFHAAVDAAVGVPAGYVNNAIDAAAKKVLQPVWGQDMGQHPWSNWLASPAGNAAMLAVGDGAMHTGDAGSFEMTAPDVSAETAAKAQRAAAPGLVNTLKSNVAAVHSKAADFWRGFEPSENNLVTLRQEGDLPPRSLEEMLSDVERRRQEESARLQKAHEDWLWMYGPESIDHGNPNNPTDPAITPEWQHKGEKLNRFAEYLRRLLNKD